MIESAYSRNLRIAAKATGVGAIVFGLLAAGDITRDSAELVPAFTWFSVTLFCGLPIAMAGFAQWGSVRVVRGLARAHTIVALAIIILWMPFDIGGPIPGGGAPWILNMVAVAAASVVVAWRTSIVWGYIVVLATTGAALRFAALGFTDAIIPLEDGLSMIEFSIVLAMLLVVALRIGRQRDAALASAVVEAQSAAAASSRARQRSRFAALVHDDVLTTLLAAAQSSVRAQAIDQSAVRSIARLDSFISTPSPDVPLDAALLEIEVRSAVTDVVDGVTFYGSFEEFAGDVPGTVVLAITGALAEASRNSVRHAGRGPVRRQVRMHAGAEFVRIEFADDGAGFDPTEAEKRNRFGLRSGIVERMLAVGGHARAESAPGAGTVVAIGWPVVE
jgi:signal transduction histidine kinase